MNKNEFIEYMTKKRGYDKASEAKKTINDFIDTVIDAFNEKKEISLVGFGNFYTTHVKARDGRNPKTGDSIKIKAYNQPKFKPGQKLKDACN